jgi:hypothetical protein
VREAVTAQLAAGDSIIVLDRDVVIGRDGDIKVESQAVSKKHCRVFFAEGAWFIEDLESDNGTFVNGDYVFSARKLQHADVIRLGGKDAPLWTAHFEERGKPKPKPPAERRDEQRAERERVRYEAEVAALREQLAEVGKERDALLRERDSLVLSRAEDATKLANLERRLTSEIEEHRATKISLLDLQKRCAAMEQELADHRKRRTETDAALQQHDTLTRDLRKLEKEFDGLAKRYRNLETEGTQLASTRDELLERNERVTADFERMLMLSNEQREQITNLEKQCELLKADLERAWNAAGRR